MLPRGIRNNNPLNIRRGKDQWQGLKAQQTDAQFCQFESLEYGWRAAFYLLTRTYYHKYRLYTIRAIINKWAPPSENQTSKYIENVCRLTGIAPDEPIGIPSDQPQRWMAVGTLDGGWVSDGDTGKWDGESRLLRHAARVGDGKGFSLR